MQQADPTTTGLPQAVSQPFVISSRVQTRADRLRNLLSAAAILLACALWYLALGKLQATTEGLPWYVTCGFIAICTALHAARAKQEYFLTSVSSCARRPLTLLESWAGTALTAAALLYAWVLLHSFLPAPVPPKVVQVVDIQLTSVKDFANRESPMPGTEEQSEMHKRQADKVTTQGAMVANKIATIARKSEQPTKPHPTPQQPPVQPENKDAAPDSSMIFTVRPAQKPVAPKREEIADKLFVKPTPRFVAATSKPASQPVLEEVQPPEMVEMIENDGASEANSVFQSGGSSEGGKGAANDLSTYIKELHRRIKGYWSPPRGQSRRARILFRVRKNGQLAFLKLVASSGDSETDEAAIKAIMGAVKGRQLPENYSLPFLDVQYTFNYTADEMKEVRLP